MVCKINVHTIIGKMKATGSHVTIYCDNLGKTFYVPQEQILTA